MRPPVIEGLSTVERCDRVIRLDRGGVIGDGPPRAVLAQA
jgi:ABC-type multidrug transport system fused ATPase/permease subunit